MMAVVVATTLVREARSKTVSMVMGMGGARQARRPKALRYTILPWWPTRMTAPGMCPAAISCLAAWSILAKRGRVDLGRDLRASGADGAGVTTGGGSTLATGGGQLLGAAAQTGKTKGESGAHSTRR